MSGDGEIIAQVVEDAVVVPETALRYRSDGIYVEVSNGDDAPPSARDVEIGIVDGTRVQILSGLSPGEQVRLQ